MEWRWNGGVERKAKPLRECWTFFNLHFPASVMKAMSRICACKTEKNLQMFGWCLQFKQSCLWATLSYFCLRKQGRKINAMRRVVFRKCVKKSSVLSHVKCEEVSLQIEFTTLPPKPQPLCENCNEKGIGETRKCGHRPIMHSITRRNEMWGGVKWEDSGREGVGGSFVPTYIWAGWNGMTIHILSNSIKKGTFTYSESNPRDSRNQEMWRWCSQIASDYMKSSFNPLRHVSAPPPPPPPALPLVLRVRFLSSPLLILHVVHRGVPK